MQQIILWVYIFIQLILVFALIRLILRLLPFPFFFAQQLPYVPTDTITIKQIINSGSLEQAKTIVDLGCGTGTLLKAIHRKYPKAKLVGVEYRSSLAVIARLRFIHYRYKPQIITGDMFHYPLQHADVIVGFWIKSLMPQLLQKFEHECKSGTIIISNKYSLPPNQNFSEESITFKKQHIFIYTKK